MAAAQWRQRRAWRMETAALNREMANYQSRAAAGGEEIEDDTTCAAIAFRTLSDESRVLDLIIRCEGRFDRQFDRALDRFHEIRSRQSRTATAALPVAEFAEKTKIEERTQQVVENVG